MLQVEMDCVIAIFSDASSEYKVNKQLAITQNSEGFVGEMLHAYTMLLFQKYN